ncbi:hypothetical protein ACFY9N_09525 [Microbacterium sp. NPDC008134]|jgi:hypothetical protein|uniref:hypothetical protein n=1 Tax=Microbacterium sp. NPDC008134 TaxID=3364183 RepID=UPI0036E8FD82
MRSTRAVLSALIVAGLLVASAPAAASAATGADEVDPQIAQMLDEIPGGVLIDSHRAVWPELDMEVTVPGAVGGFASRAAVGSCATGRICAYSSGSLMGTSVSWGTCGILTVPSGFVPRSLANARSSGYAQARNSAGGVLATANAGAWANVGGTAKTVRCVL